VHFFPFACVSSTIQVLAFDEAGMLIMLQKEKVASGMKLLTLRAMMGAMAGFGCLQQDAALAESAVDACCHPHHR
jgi:hypothetical protein